MVGGQAEEPLRGCQFGRGSIGPTQNQDYKATVFDRMESGVVDRGPSCGVNKSKLSRSQENGTVY